MANSCYKECWWLTRAITGYYDSGEFKKGEGFRLESLAKFYTTEFKVYYNMLDPKERKSFSVMIWRLRIRLYFQFGLVVFSDSTDAAVRGKGNGGHFYYLANPDKLDDGGRTLREHMELLAKFENNIPTKVNWEELKKQYTPTTSTMGFLSAGNTSAYGYQMTPGTTPRTILGEEKLQIVQFAMLVGEVLTIKYGKIRTGVNINAPYSFEPYQLKEIEGRWYVIGNLYPLGHKESAEISVYDLARLQFADEENPDVLYEPVKGFDINDERTLADICKKNNRYLEGGYFCAKGVVQTIRLMAHTEEFANYLYDYPLCSAQERITEGVFQIYTTLTTDLFVMLGAYGAELSFRVLWQDEGFFPEEIENQLNFFRNTREE